MGQFIGERNATDLNDNPSGTKNVFFWELSAISVYVSASVTLLSLPEKLVLRFRSKAFYSVQFSLLILPPYREEATDVFSYRFTCFDYIKWPYK